MRIDYRNVLFGNGASELIMAVTYAVNPKRVLLLAPSFSGYLFAAKSLGCEIDQYELEDVNEFELTEEILDKITNKTDLLYLCSPMNPTGKIINTKLLMSILDRCLITDTKVLLDVCYMNLSPEILDAMYDNKNLYDRKVLINHKDLFDHKLCHDLITEYSNLYIIDAFTKTFAIPGIRAGIVLSSSNNIEKIQKVLPEWNISIMAYEAIRAGIYELDDKQFFEQTASVIYEERCYLDSELNKIDGIRTIKSEANFILFYSDTDYYSGLLQKEILIRDCSNISGLKKGWYRVSVMNHEANELLIRSMREVRYGN